MVSIKSIRSSQVFIAAFFTILLNSTTLFSQNDSTKLNLDRVYALGLNANIPALLKEINPPNGNLIKAHQEICNRYNLQFKGSKDRSSYLKDHASSIDPLLKQFHAYWRQSMLDTANHHDSSFIKQLTAFFIKENKMKGKKVLSEAELDSCYNLYIAKQSLYSTPGIGKVGKLLDLLVWRSQNDTVYKFKIRDEELNVRVVFMNDFISLGWEEYATLGRHYPGGWATKDALYCVRKAYDLNSESFLVSYLAHEGRHYSDYKIFPNIKSEELEYRAKLTELSLAKKTAYSLIEFFLSNASRNSEGGHQKANYRVISDLSKAIFGKEMESDSNKWKAINVERINEMSYQILSSNTAQLKEKQNSK